MESVKEPVIKAEPKVELKKAEVKKEPEVAPEAKKNVDGKPAKAETDYGF